MMKRLSVFGFALSACLAGSLPRAESRVPRAADVVRTHRITISNFAFAPAALTVARGDTVEWLNRDAFAHTTTEDSAAWTSPQLAKDGRFIFVPSRSGRFEYHCAAHPVMRGEITVQ